MFLRAAKQLMLNNTKSTTATQSLRKLHAGTATLASRLKHLTQEQKDQYVNDGYTVAHGVLSKEEVEHARNAIEELKERTRTLKVEDEITVYELGEHHSEDRPVLNRVRFPGTQHEAFYNLQRHPKVLDCVEDLIGPSFRYMLQDKLNVKPAGHGDEIPWHQDWAHFPYTNDSVLTTSILLYDSHRGNGCLKVVRKSHTGPTLSHHNENLEFVAIITEENFEPDNVAYLEGEAGSVTFHHVRSIHGSDKNASDTPRTTLCNIYASMDAWSLLGVVDGSDWGVTGPVCDKLFNKTLLRGKPCMHPRMENIPVTLPIPLDKKQYSVIRKKE